jgi:GDP-L-fucose synthase
MRQEVVYVAGGQTLIGSALVRRLAAHGFTQIIGGDHDPDLSYRGAVEKFFLTHKPAFVIIASGKSGGIAANQKYPAAFMYDNLVGSTNLIHAAHEHGVKKLLYLASSCSYPRLCPQPMAVEQLMTGPLEPTNEAYAVAKLAGLKLCQAYRQEHGVDFIVGIPANAFGVGDDFSGEDSHVIGALIGRMHNAKMRGEPSMAVWGSGSPRREFIFADDLADACLFVLECWSSATPINLGGGDAVSIAELAAMIKQVIGYQGELKFDTTRPDGMPLKALDSQPLQALGWKPSTPMAIALQRTYQDFLAQGREPEPVMSGASAGGRKHA